MKLEFGSEADKEKTKHAPAETPAEVTMEKQKPAMPMTVSSCTRSTDPPMSSQKMEELTKAIQDVKAGQKAERKAEKQKDKTDSKAAPKMAAKKAKAKAKANTGKKQTALQEESDTLDSEEPLSSQEIWPAESENDEDTMPCACHAPHFSSGNHI